MSNDELVAILDIIGSTLATIPIVSGEIESLGLQLDIPDLILRGRARR